MVCWDFRAVFGRPRPKPDRRETKSCPGVIFGNDLTYNFDQQTWKGHPENSADNIVKRSKNNFTELIKNTYRVLLLRGMKGCYIYFVDEDTEKFFKSRIESRFEMKHLEVVGGILIFQGKILCMQRNIGKYEYLNFKYEFPGGKIEAGENHPQALMRELKEEMDLDLYISETDYFGEVSYQYTDFEITLYCYLCHLSSDRFQQKEHANFKWMNQNELDTLDWAPADYPIVKKLEKVVSLE